MFIIWSGLGWLVLAVLLISFSIFSGEDEVSNSQFAYVLLSSAIVIYLLGRYFNGVAERKTAARALEEGEMKFWSWKYFRRVGVGGVIGDPAERPKLFFIPMTWWGIILSIGGILSLFSPQ